MDKIFNWKKYTEWSDEFKRMTDGLLNDKFIKEIKKNTNEIYTDHCGPLEEMIGDGEDNIANYKKFIEVFKNSYTHIMTYHACRPVEAKNYYINGLQKIDYEILQDRVRKIYLNEPFPEMTEKDIEKAIEVMSQDYSSNELYVTLDDRQFITDCGHYLIYGSEYMSCLALRLKPESYYDYRAHLRTIGIPTIFRIKLPLRMVDDDDLRCLYSVAVRHWIYNYANDRKHNRPIDFTFLVTDNIPAENIISHWHPQTIQDWLNHGKIYHVKENRYTDVLY
jgi:hypothetical protein